MRTHWWVSALGLLGIAAGIATPLVEYASWRKAEGEASRALIAIARAQTAFVSQGGNGGYASTLESLLAPCPGVAQALLPASGDAGDLRTLRYELLIRPGSDAMAVATDCHGRPAVNDYYASASPRVNGVDGQRAFAMTSEGRIYVFFDGIPPRESDMSPGGLAVALDALDTFKIP